MILGVFIAQYVESFDSTRYSQSILNLELVNSNDFSLGEISKYFKSEKFKEDLKACALDYDEKIYNRLNPYLKLERDSGGNLELKIKSY